MTQLTTQLKRYVRQIPASLMEDLAFTQSALGLLFNIDTLFLINLQNKLALFCSVKSFHFPITCIGLIVTQMHPMTITCKIEMTPELTVMKFCRHLHEAKMYMQNLRARGKSLLSYFPL